MTVIRVIDIETTGIDAAEHRVCEVGWCDLTAHGEVLLGESVLINPERPIPPEASAVHHLIDADVAEAQTWPAFCQSHRRVAEVELQALAAHNAKFEQSYCAALAPSEMPWICTYKCALRLWPDAPSHSNQALRYWRNPAGLARLIADRAHRALPDAYVTAFLLRDMLQMDGVTVEKMIEWSSQPALQVTCHIGKNRGRKWSEIDSGFLRWLLDKDFDEDVLFTAQTELRRREEGAAA